MARGLTSPPQKCTCKRHACGKAFYAYPNRKGTSGQYPKFCSRECYHQEQRAKAAIRKSQANRQLAVVVAAVVVEKFLAAKGFKVTTPSARSRDNVVVHMKGDTIDVSVRGDGRAVRSLLLDVHQWPPNAICEIIRAVWAERYEAAIGGASC